MSSFESKVPDHLLDDRQQSSVVHSDAATEKIAHVRDLRQQLVGSCAALRETKEVSGNSSTMKTRADSPFSLVKLFSMAM